MKEGREFYPIERQYVIDQLKKEGKPGKHAGRSLYSVIVQNDPAKDANHGFVVMGREDQRSFGIDVINGSPKYLFLDDLFLGSGGGGKTFLAYENTQDSPRLFALKSSFGIEDFLSVVEEAREYAKVDHPYIARVFELVADEDKNLYILSEFLEGPRLSRVGYDFTPGEAHRLVFQMCSAISFIHRNIMLHNDVKPGNFMFKHPIENGNDLIIKSIDLGSVTYLSGNDDELKPRSVSEGWSAPDYPDYWGTRSDIYSLAMTVSSILFEKFKVPPDSYKIFWTLNRAEFNPSFQLEKNREALDEIKKTLTRALDPDASQRYPGVRAFYSDLNRVFVKIGCPDNFSKLLD